MKKVLLIGLILAICILAFPQGVMAATSSAEVNANIVPSLTFTATGTGTTFDLSAGPAFTTLPDAVSFYVKSNGAWNINVNSAPNGGKMVPATAESGAQPLDKVMEIWSVPANGWSAVTSTADILTGVNTPDAGSTYPTDIRQETVFTDARLLNDGNAYQITLGFECIQNV